MFTSSRTTETATRPVKALLMLATAGSLSVVLAAGVSVPALASPPKDKLKKAVRHAVSSHQHSKRGTTDTVDSDGSDPAVTTFTTDDDDDDDDDADDNTSTTTTTAIKRHLNRHLHLAGAGEDCNRGTFFKIHSLEPRHFYVPRTRFVDGPGGSMTVSVHREHEVLAFVEADFIKLRQFNRTITPDTVIRALTRISRPHLEKRHMVFTGHDYTQTVSKGKYGNMWYRVFGYRVHFGVRARLDSCKVLNVTNGIADIPSRVEGWRYWETDKPKFHGHVLSQK
ncbi:hypothetical protein ACIBG4_12395 [Nonomuraea sp. NPDC050383]|uniref:hypothetical protein n=1 Tax=Nonomuraea sp. NPDC050383 TaxID=3364362 RepID=UPI0037A6AD77